MFERFKLHSTTVFWKLVATVGLWTESRYWVPSEASGPEKGIFCRFFIATALKRGDPCR
jgi:hypothetical protein